MTSRGQFAGIAVAVSILCASRPASSTEPLDLVDQETIAGVWQALTSDYVHVVRLDVPSLKDAKLVLASVDGWDVFVFPLHEVSVTPKGVRLEGKLKAATIVATGSGRAGGRTGRLQLNIKVKRKQQAFQEYDVVLLKDSNLFVRMAGAAGRAADAVKQ
jgi:hypothetical protein